MRRERYQAQAGELFARVERSADPERTAQQMLEQLERKAEAADTWQACEEQFLAQAVELLRRADQARQAAERASDERARIEGERQREKERLRKNARARERYRQRRLIEPARVNKRTGMHALAIDVDQPAYRAVRAEAFRRQTPIPRVVGEIVRETLRTRNQSAAPPGSRWRRTGEGRRANQHTRIDLDDETWQAVHIEAFQSGRTVARWIGLALESWARREHAEEVPDS